MSELKVLREGFHSQLLTTRSIYRLLLTSEFESAFSNSSDLERAALKQIVESRSQPALQEWIRVQNVKSKDYSQLPMRELRLQCQKLGVLGYQYLPKSSLLSALRNNELRTKHELQVV